ncbi:MAG: hypothetical protein JKY37_07605 [Nannocystaceae bacterium]|nr:hypothetical protein [Nannocystaceae bacterium]
MDIRIANARVGHRLAQQLGPAAVRKNRAAARLRMLFVTLLGIVLWGGGTSARASIPVAEDGEGIKVGQRSTFHPGFALVSGVDSNVFYGASEEDPQAAAFISPTGWLGIGNRQVRDGLLMKPPERSARLADYSLRAVMNFRQYLARQDNIRQQARISGGGILRLAILPGRRFEIDLDEDFFRTAQPSNFDAGSEFNFNRIDHNGTLRFIGRPGGGRVGIGVGYNNQLLRFQSSDERDIAKGNRMINGTQTEVKWRFLPKSSLFFSYDFAWSFYLDCCESIGEGRNEDNYAHRIRGGFRGQVLRKVALDATAGWGFGYYRDDPNGPSFSSFIGHLGLDYFPTLRTNPHLSGYRQFQDSLLGNYFVDNGARLAARHQWRWRMYSTLGVGVAGRRYAGLPTQQEDESIEGYVGRGAREFRREDVLFVLDAKIEQPVKRIWSFGLQYDLVVDSANFVTTFVPQDGDDAGSRDIAGFTKHVIMLLAAVRI